MCGWLSAEGDRLELSQLGGGLDEIARHLLEPGDDLRLDPPDLRAGLGRRHLEANPAVTILGDPPQRRVALAAEPHRHSRCADRLWITRDASEVDELAGMRTRLLGPQLAHHVDVFAGPRAASVERNPQRGEFLGEPADPGTENEPA